MNPARVPSTFLPEWIWAAQCASPPPPWCRQKAQFPHAPRTQEIPTRCPIRTWDSPSAAPSFATRPIPSWPRMGRVWPSAPEASAKSVPHRPVTESFTRTSVGPGCGSGRETISKWGFGPGDYVVLLAGRVDVGLELKNGGMVPGAQRLGDGMVGPLCCLLGLLRIEIQAIAGRPQAFYR